jgi:hypothetical protein
MEPQVAVVETKPPLHNAFSIEVEYHIFKRLSTISIKEEIPIRLLTSELLKHMLLFERREVQQIIAKIRRNQKCPVS